MERTFFLSPSLPPLIVFFFLYFFTVAGVLLESSPFMVADIGGYDTTECILRSFGFSSNQSLVYSFLRRTKLE